MIRALCRVAAAMTVGAAGVVLTVGHAGAASVSATGAWVKAGVALPTVPAHGMVVGDDPTAAVNPNQPPPLPVALPVAPPPINLPGPQLNGYTAVSAFRIVDVPPNDDVTMTLPFAPGSLPPLPTVATIIACPIPAEWKPPAGGVGDVSQAPADNCNTASVGRLGADDLSMSWLLPHDYQATPGELDIELQPGVSSVPFPFLVAFAPPAPSSLKEAAGGPLPTTPPPTVESLPPVVDQTPGPTAAPPPLPLPVAVAAPPTPATTQAPVPTPTITPINRLARIIPAVSDDRSHRIMAVVLLLAIGVALWWIGGRTDRGPRRLGALAADGTSAAHPEGGIGRFRRVRSARPPRL